jgi:hypothetical protein
LPNNKPINHYTLELELPRDQDSSIRSVRCIATNTDDCSTAEATLTLQQARSVVDHTYGGVETVVAECMEQLDENGYISLVAQFRGSRPDLCIFTSQELGTFGFNLDDLRQ